MIKKIFVIFLILLCCQISQATIIILTEESGINFIPFNELFAPDYQPRYIIGGQINVGPNSYDVFTDYTTVERQQIFQVCEKHLPWEYILDQEQWERTMYMYQFVIKSPPPFPYPEYHPIPEPTTIAILGVGCLSFLMSKR